MSSPARASRDIFNSVEDMMQNLLGELELLVLSAVLRLEGRAYGVPIAAELRTTTGRRVALGSIYAALERLEQKEFVTSQVGDPTPERGGRGKR